MTDTKTKILDLAEKFTQERGFGGFSYLDLADKIGIKSASIHYHFKSKDDLAIALVARTHEMHMKNFQQLDETMTSPRKRLEYLIKYFQGYATENKFCMCGMLTAELYSVSPTVRDLLNKYFKDFQAWLAKQFSEMGIKNADQHALRFLSALEGGLLLARLRDEPKMIGKVMSDFFKN
jgi:TetR/AcrR family transcriptional regulator, transcriptional repressor for nem operon